MNPVDEKIKLITRHVEEVLTEDDLRKLLESGKQIKHYIGFEISGKIHLGSGLMTMLVIKDLMEAGVDINILLADWHTWINDKLGGDRKIIQEVAVNYFKEGMIATCQCVGADPSKLHFVLGSDLYHQSDRYWATVIDVSKHTTLARIKRSITIMGRKEGDSLDFAKLIYPPMQVADIFFQGVTLAHAGMDQRKAHVIMRDVSDKLQYSQIKNSIGERIKPVAIHHPLLLGLGKPPTWPIPNENRQELWSSLKMSKSKPDTCLFIHDSEEEIRRKINKAFCPERETSFNPMLDWAKHLIFSLEGAWDVLREEKNGGDVHYKTYEVLEKDFANGKLHPLDLKHAMADAMIRILKPARLYFSKGVAAKSLIRLESLMKT